MESDLRYMEYTENLVGEMLRSLLASDDQCGGQKILKIDETVEYVVLDETEGKLKTSIDSEMNKEQRNRNDFDKTAMKIDCTSENPSVDYTDMSDLDRYISEGLNKIRLEYPMYAVTSNANVYTGEHNASVPIFGVTPVTGNSFVNYPYNTWSNDTMSTRSLSCSPSYNNEINSFYGDDYWENMQCEANDVSVEWPHSKATPLDVTKSTTQESTQNNENIDTESILNEEGDDGIEEDDTKSACSLPENTNVHCFMTHDQGHMVCNKSIPNSLIQSQVSHYKVNSNANGISCATGGTTSHVQLCAGSPTALHAEQSTTTTTTSGGFGVLHQQTSCTTTNFVPNNLANAVLATSPAALYAQSILTSSANQYLNLFRKEIQQLFTNNNNNYGNATTSNWNVRIFERLLYAQLLQQQILQQQQQQAAIAALLQQQKLALQNNAANNAATAISTCSNSNVAATSSGTVNNIASINAGKNINKSNTIMDVTEKNNFNDLTSAVAEEGGLDIIE